MSDRKLMLNAAFSGSRSNIGGGGGVWVAIMDDYRVTFTSLAD